MEENNNQEVTLETQPTTEGQTEVTPVVEETPVTEEVQTIDGISAPVDNQTTEVTTQPDFVTADQIGGTPLSEVEGTPLPKKKKVNKTLIIVLVFVVVFGGVMLLMNMGNKNKSNNNNKKEEEKLEVKVNTGTDWGDKYLTFLMTEKPDLKTYEISFIDVNPDDDEETPEIPEMFVKYIDNSDKESLKIFFISDDGYVYESKYYRDFRIRYIYSLKDETLDWYVYLTTTKNYGSYTKASKIIDNMAFDADIKATNDALLIEYGKRYFDTDYQPVFYTIKELTAEDDFRNFVSKYKGYKEEVDVLTQQVLEKYEDYVFVEEEKEDTNSIGIAGRIYKYGSYYAVIPANSDLNVEEHIKVITLYKNGKISVDGVLYDYEVNYDESTIIFGNQKFIKLLPGKFNYMGKEYSFME
ncbi:MAG: hypothetical protein E7171_04725 [Firmicutes bacterium]|nr:hypothetical protein [Bacillota bacterium]